MNQVKAKLILEDGTIFEGEARGFKNSTSGEVVFATGMVGYDLSLTDPSYAGQILTFTYPLIGNWGMPPKEMWESEKIQVKGVVISDLTDKPSHYACQKTLEEWLIENKVPAIVNVDTRALTQKLRDKGVMLGKIVVDNQDVKTEDPNLKNLVAEVSIYKPKLHIPNPKSRNSPRIALLNCGAKKSIAKCLTKRGATVYELPWNFDPFESNLSWEKVRLFSRERSPGFKSTAHHGDFSPTVDHDGESNRTKAIKSATAGNLLIEPQARNSEIKIDGLVISNGPGDPKMAKESIKIIEKALKKKIPTLGICLGNQLLTLAAGGDTYKLKFGHRAQNQPTLQAGTKRCFITTQNHGFAVNEKRLPDGFKPWFINANDNTNEGIIHQKLPFASVQFHPEAMPGPMDTEWIFDKFLESTKK